MAEEMINGLKQLHDHCDALKKGLLEQERKIEELQGRLEAVKRDALQEARRMRMKELFQDVAKTYWKISWEYQKAGEKCGECDSEGWLHYTSPSGLRVMETCRCRWRRMLYVPEAIQLYESRLLNGELLLWYSARNENSSGLSSREFQFYEGGDFAENMRYFIFRTREDAERYAKWLNEHTPARYVDQVICIEK